jgi:hypothetical protein
MKLFYYLYVKIFISISMNDNSWNPFNKKKNEKTFNENLVKKNKILTEEEQEEENILLNTIENVEHLSDLIFPYNKQTYNTVEEYKKKLRSKNIILLYSLSVFSTLMVFISTILNYVTAFSGNARFIGLITSSVQFLISLLLLIFNKNDTVTIFKLIGLLYLFLISWLFFLSGFVISQIGPYESIYGNLSGNSQYSDYALIMYVCGHTAYYTSGIAFLLEQTRLTHYEIALFCLA